MLCAICLFGASAKEFLEGGGGGSSRRMEPETL